MFNTSSTSSFAATSVVACRRMPQPHIQAGKWRSRNLPCNVPPTLISSRPIATAPPIKVSSLEREPLARCSRCASSLSASFYSITEPVFLILPSCSRAYIVQCFLKCPIKLSSPCRVAVPALLLREKNADLDTSLPRQVGGGRHVKVNAERQPVVVRGRFRCDQILTTHLPGQLLL
jgi:hypothetical protein